MTGAMTEAMIEERYIVRTAENFDIYSVQLPQYSASTVFSFHSIQLQNCQS
jgi:hypothetical protein